MNCRTGTCGFGSLWGYEGLIFDELQKFELVWWIAETGTRGLDLGLGYVDFSWNSSLKFSSCNCEIEFMGLEMLVS